MNIASSSLASWHSNFQRHVKALGREGNHIQGNFHRPKSTKGTGMEIVRAIVFGALIRIALSFWIDLALSS